MGNSHSAHRPPPVEAAVGDSDAQVLRAGPRNAPQLSGRSVFSHSRHSILHDSWRRQSQRLFGDGDPSPPHRAFQPIEDTSLSSEQDDRMMPYSNDDPGPPVEPDYGPPPANWRESTMYRLGSRLLPESVVRGLTTSGEETAAEGRALRGSRVRSRPSVYNRRVPASSLTGGTYTRVASSWRRAPQDPPTNPPSNVRFHIRRFFSEPATTTPAAEGQTIEGSNTAETALTFPDDEAVSLQDVPTRSASRLTRVRNSLSTTVAALFRTTDRFDHTRSHASNSRSSRITFADESDELLPSSNATLPRQDVDDTNGHETETEPESRTVLSGRRITSGMSTIRRLPHGLRSRSTRLIRHGEHPPLSQVLQLAAAAIAAQLHGSPGYNAESTTNPDAFDGSIQNFVQTLQEVASAHAGQDLEDSSTGDLPPVNFVRVFQFPNDENGSPISSIPSSRPDSSHQEVDLDNPDRSVTLVLVGVRSMPNVHDGPNENGTLGPSLDTLLRDPFLPPANVLRNGSAGALFRRSDIRPQSQNRRHSMNNFPQQYESQRHSRQRSLQSRPGTDLPTLADSPPGPAPPPTTPADARSGNATPIRRPSSSSAAHAPALPNLDENQDTQEVVPTELSFNASRHRRRSDSEFARRPELSSGNSRRHGVVGPNGLASPGRSWLIYVIGTNVAPDHPAFTMPSLFTDNPSYEDMQMLTTLLGPVKPPTATQEEIEAAGGVFRVVRAGEPLRATIESDLPILALSATDRCLVCLCEYEDGDEVRRINDCSHVYHRECVDEWLLTGRNSCPMCRRQGVKETSTNDHPEPEIV